MTWLIVSAPLFVTWRDWTERRLKAVSAIAQNDKTKERDVLMGLLDKLQPVSFWNLTGSAIVAAVSFILPIVQGTR